MGEHTGTIARARGCRKTEVGSERPSGGPIPASASWAFAAQHHRRWPPLRHKYQHDLRIVLYTDRSHQRSVPDADSNDERDPQSVRCQSLPLCLLALPAACAEGSTPQMAQRSTVRDVTVYFETEVAASGETRASNLVQYWGRFQVRNGCLTLAIHGRQYTPVFPSRAAFEPLAAAIRTPAEGDLGLWSFGGSAYDESLHAALPKPASGCPDNFFLVTAPAPADVSKPRLSPERPD